MPELVLQSGHSKTVNGLAFSPDGTILASGSGDRTVRLWDVASHRLRATLHGHNASVKSVMFSPDGKTIASGSFDTTVRLWDATTGQPKATLEGNESPINTIAFSPDGTTIAAGRDDGTVIVWDTTTGSPEVPVAGSSESVSSVAFSPDGKTLAWGSRDKTARLWDLASAASGPALPEHVDGVWALAFSPDGRTLATGTLGTVQLWDSATGELKAALDGGFLESFLSLAFSPDGKEIAAAGTDKQVTLWDVASGERKITFRPPLATRAVVFSPDGRTLASAGDDMSVRLWDGATGQPIATLQGMATDIISVAISQDGKSIAAGSTDNQVQLWDTHTGVVRGRVNGLSWRFNSVAFSPDGKAVATAGNDEVLRISDVTTGAVRARCSHEDTINGVAFSPDGKVVASGGNDRTVRLWDAETGAPRGTMTDNQQIFGLAFSPDGKSIVAAAGMSVVLWDLANDSKRTITRHSAKISSVAFSPDGRTIATGDFDAVRLFDLSSGELRATLQRHTDEDVAELLRTPAWAWVATEMNEAFSGDGTLLVSGSMGKYIRVWDPATGELKDTLRGHSGHVVAFGGPHGRLVVAGGPDGVALWRLADHALVRLAVLPTASGVGTLAYMPNGLFTGDEEAFEKVVYRIGTNVARGELVTADQLFERFHRSTLLLDFLEGRALDLPVDLRGGVGASPELGVSALPREVHTDRVPLQLVATDRGGGVGELRVYVNGARVGGRLSVEGPAKLERAEEPDSRTDSDDQRVGGAGRAGDQEGEALWGPGKHRIALRLAPGDNVVSAEAYNLLGKIRGQRVRQTVFADLPDEGRPVLFLLALSVGRYSDADDRLEFTNDDASAIVAAMKRQTGRLFERVEVTRLADENARRQTLEAALSRIAGAARPRDVFVLYVSSHGTVARCDDAIPEYQMLLSGATATDPCRDSLPVRRLTQLVGAVPAQDKLVLLDTCHAGSVVNASVLEQLRGRLRDEQLRDARAAGVAIIAAAAANKASYEVPSWRHGLFTVALLRGLEGRAALVDERRVGVGHLGQYVSRQLPILGLRSVGVPQTPAYGMLGSDFTVALLEDGDPPLLGPVGDPLASTETRGTLRSLGMRAEILRHLDDRRRAALECTKGQAIEVVARWPASGMVSFSVASGAGGASARRCVAKALGSMELTSVSGPGEVRTAIAPTW